MITPIPHFQSIPFPAPLWFLKTCLVVGFYLHALPMNVTLTGGFVAAFFLIKGSLQNHLYSQRFGHTLALALPFFVSVAITQGIVPLLFLQLVYGPLFYTSSILIALPWLMVIFLVLTAYYGFYIYRYQQQKLGRFAPWLLIFSGLFFLVVAFFFTNNMTLMLAPDRWLAMYQKSPYGINLNLADPQVIPRYLHFVIAACAVTGLTMGCFGLYWRSRESDYSKWLIQTGAGLYIIATLLQIPIGIWFLLSLKAPIMMSFLGGDPTGTGIFITSLIIDVVGLIAMTMAWKSGRSKPFIFGLILALIVIFLMVVMRHLLRVYSIAGAFSPNTQPVQTQWVLLVLFLGGAIIAIVYLIWLLKIAFRAYNPPSGESIRPAS